MAECGPWLEAVKETKNILSVRKQDRKKWQVLFVKLKAELKVFCKATQKVVAGVGGMLGPLAGTRNIVLVLFAKAFAKNFPTIVRKPLGTVNTLIYINVYRVDSAKIRTPIFQLPRCFG